MKDIPVHDMKGKTTGKMPLNPAYFDGKIDNSLLQQTVLMYLTNQRRGCASTKTRSQIRGGGRKPWRQKGTGRARAGTIRSPLWRGGGIIFGPHPRHYGYSLPKKIKSLALKLSLNGKIRDNELVVVDKIFQGRPKTKEFSSFLSALKVKDKLLIVLEKYNPDILRASRNIPGVSVKAFNNINAYDVLKHKKVIFSTQALENLVKMRKR